MSKKPVVVDRYIQNDPLVVSDWLAFCCGASVNNKPTTRTRFKHPGKGIRVFAGKHSEEFDNGKTYLSHVETSAGTLTITINYDK